MYEQKMAPVFSFFSKVAMLGRGFVELGLIFLLQKLNHFLKASMDFNGYIRGNKKQQLQTFGHLMKTCTNFGRYIEGLFSFFSRN